MAAPAPTPRQLQIQNTLEGHKWVVTALAFSPDSKVLASGGDGTVRLWDATTGKTIHILPKAGFAPAFSPDGKTLASCGDRRFLLWDVASGKNIATIFAGFPVHAVMFSPDGKTLSAIEKNWIVVWDREKKEEVRSWEMPSKPFLVTADGSIKRPLMAICPKEGRWRDAQSFTLIDAFTGKSVLDCAGHEMEVSGVALNPDETMIASTGGRNPSVRLWKRGTGEHIATFDHPTGTSRCLAFSPEGKILASGFRNIGIVRHAAQVFERTSSTIALFLGRLFGQTARVLLLLGLLMILTFVCQHERPWAEAHLPADVSRTLGRVPPLDGQVWILLFGVLLYVQRCFAVLSRRFREQDVERGQG